MFSHSKINFGGDCDVISSFYLIFNSYFSLIFYRFHPFPFILPYLCFGIAFPLFPSDNRLSKHKKDEKWIKHGKK